MALSHLLSIFSKQSTGISRFMKKQCQGSQLNASQPGKQAVLFFKKSTRLLTIIAFCLIQMRFFNTSVFAATSQESLQAAVFANEAIIATYTLDHAHFLEQEKALAKYFTSSGWINYSQALQASHLPSQIKENAYYVSAVATSPPTVKSLAEGEWEATMPILVLYKNPSYSQKQNLNVTLRFVTTTTQGTRGFAVQSLKSTVTTPPCECIKPRQGATIV